MRINSKVIVAVTLSTLLPLITHTSRVYGQELQPSADFLVNEANRLIARKGCSDLIDAATLLNAYQVLRSNNGNKLVDNSPTLREVSARLGKHCNVRPSYFGGGGSVGGNQIVINDTLKIGGKEVDVLSVALLYMGEEERNTFLNTINAARPDYAETLTGYLKQNSAIKDLKPAIDQRIGALRLERDQQLIMGFLREQIKRQSTQQPKSLDLMREQ